MDLEIPRFIAGRTILDHLADHNIDQLEPTLLYFYHLRLFRQIKSPYTPSRLRFCPITLADP